MNETLPDMAVDNTALDHFILGLDEDGNEVKIKVNPLGELEHRQDIDDIVFDDEEPL